MFWQAVEVSEPVDDPELETHLRSVMHAAWDAYGDPRRLIDVVELSAMVSTNRVYRLMLDDGGSVVAKVSNYGSYFLFSEDHDRLHRCQQLLGRTRYEQFLAEALTRDDRPFIYYDGRYWAILYHELPIAQRLGRVLSPAQVDNLATEMAEFHQTCTEIAPELPPSSKSVKSDAIHLLDLVSDRHASLQFGLDQSRLDIVRRHTHQFLMALEDYRYDDWVKVPVLVDWNLGNFSVEFSGENFRLFSRWDYDWFRIESRMFDFYFLSRVSSRTGDKTRFTYGAHTLTEPRFVRFIAAYHRAFALTEHEVRFLAEAYRFFLLNYVVREGRHFFRHDIWRSLQHDVVDQHLFSLDHLDLSVLVDQLD